MAQIERLAKMAVKVSRDKMNRNDWRVERVIDDGSVEMAIFSGPKAKERALRYGDSEYDGNYTIE